MGDLVDTIIPPKRQIMVNRSYLQLIRKLISHFLGERVISQSDTVLHAIAEALPNHDMETRIVFLSRPHSNWIKHIIMVGKAPNDVILDKNHYINVDWVKTDRAMGLEGYEYTATDTYGKPVVLWPRFVTTIREIIESGSIRYEVKRRQMKVDQKDKVKEGEY